MSPFFVNRPPFFFFKQVSFFKKKTKQAPLRDALLHFRHFFLTVIYSMIDKDNDEVENEDADEDAENIR